MFGLGLDDAEQRTPEIDDEQLGLRRGRGPQEFTADGAQCGCLSAFAVPENQKMRLLREIDC